MSSDLYVSVLVPLYNKEFYVEEALDSLINQTLDKSKFEIIIRDNCSTDNSYKIAKKYKEKYPDLIKLYQNEKNVGANENGNKIFNDGTGKYLAYLDADDYFDSDYLEKLLNKALSIKGGYDYIKCNQKEFVDGTSKVTLGKIGASKYSTHGFHSSLIKRTLWQGNNIRLDPKGSDVDPLPVYFSIGFYSKTHYTFKNYYGYNFRIQPSGSSQKNFNNNFDNIRDRLKRSMKYYHSFSKEHKGMFFEYLSIRSIMSFYWFMPKLHQSLGQHYSDKDLEILWNDMQTYFKNNFKKRNLNPCLLFMPASPSTKLQILMSGYYNLVVRFNLFSLYKFFVRQKTSVINLSN
jgi:glycosyltransferase involved in cell wall biosynthesis